jgi:hypothetical protein
MSTAVAVRRRTHKMNEHLCCHSAVMNIEFTFGVNDQRAGDRKAAQRLKANREPWRQARLAHGLGATTPRLITAPSENMKLNKSSQRPAYGFTGQHHVVKLADGTLVNLCEWAGQCTAVCVLDNGSGRYSTVQRARIARTELMWSNPGAFAYLLGRDIAWARDRHDGAIDFRPNVNTNLLWEQFLSALTSNRVLSGVWNYGYSKNDAVLAGDGWSDTRYREAYSVSERTKDVGAVGEFLARGGSVAVVTNRKPKTSVEQWTDLAPAQLGRLAPLHGFKVVDADLTDEWLWEPGVIGDLSLKGRRSDQLERAYAGRPSFVNIVY